MKKLFLSLLLLVSSIASAEELSLSPIIVSATKYETNVFEIPVAADVVGNEVTQGAKVQNFAVDSLTRVPGLISTDPGMALEPRFASRGFGAKSAVGIRGIRVLQDGIQLGNADGFSNVNISDPYLIDRIEVVRGPFASLYGNSSGGVINFITETPKDGANVEGKFLVGSYGTTQKNVKFSGTDGNAKYLIAHSRYDTDGYKDHSNAHRDNTRAKVIIDLSDSTKTTFDIYSYKLAAQDPRSVSKTLGYSNPKANESIVQYTDPWRRHDQTTASVKVEHKINDSTNVTFSAFGGVRTLDLITPSGTGVSLAKSSSTITSINRTLYGSDIKLDNSGDIYGHKYKVVVGLSGSNQSDDRKVGATLTNGVASDGKTLSKDENQTAYQFDQYIQGKIAVTDVVDVFGGLRHSKVTTKFNDNLTSSAFGGDNSGKTVYEKTIPTVGAIWNVTEFTNIYSAYGQGFETPTFAEAQYNKPSSTSGPNTALKASQSETYEAGIKSFLTNDVYTTATVFKTYTKDEILPGASSGAFKTYNNSGSTTRDGVELSINAKLDYGFGFYTSYTYLNAKFDDTSAYLPGVPKNYMFNELSWKYAPSQFKVSLEHIYSGRTYVNSENTEYANSFNVYNIKAGLTQNLKSFTINEYVALNNITDEVYAGGVRVNESTLQYYEMAPGQNWLAGASVSYKF